MPKLFEPVHKIFICVVLFLLGAKLLDKDQQMLSVVRKISYGEIFFILYLFGVLLKIIMKNSISWLFLSNYQKKFTFYLACFAVWMGLSWSINTIFRDGDIMDFFGIPVRVLFYCFMTVFVARWIKKYGPNIVVIPYCSGILMMFYYNFSTLFMDIGGVPSGVTENTFSAVLLPASAMFLALTGMARPGVLSLFLMCISLVSTFLVYSLSGLVYMLVGVPAVLLSMQSFFINTRVGIVKRLFALVFLSLIVIAIINNFGFAFEGISLNIERKINNIPFVEAAQGDSQSGKQRWGVFLSSLVITMNNPMFGVGEYNFKSENMKNKEWLGDKFFDHKNPHNALAQILSMFGIPAFFLFAMCFYITFKQLYGLRIKSGLMWKTFVLSSLFVFFATANIMDAIFTTTYFYFYAALIFGIKEWRKNSSEVALT